MIAGDDGDEGGFCGRVGDLAERADGEEAGFRGFRGIGDEGEGFGDGVRVLLTDAEHERHAAGGGEGGDEDVGEGGD